jgi:arylsulfatase A-like enzyme
VNKSITESKRKKFTAISTLGLGLSTMIITGCVPANDKDTRPNIIVIMADDMGYSDIGCFGGEIPTPNIDILGENGMLFTQFYNGGRCCPTRAALLTGLYAHQAGVGAMVSPSDEPGYLGRLNESSATFAEVLRMHGYQTFMSGKWHVTHFDYQDPQETLHQGTWPLQRGFDRFFGTLAGAGSFFNPVSLMMDNEFIDPWDDFYYTDAISDQAIRFVQEADKDKPFLLYISHVAPHWPLHARKEHIEKFKDHYSVGWDRLREERYARMLKAGLIDERWLLSPREENIPPWEEADDREWEAYRMAVYAAQIYSMDLGIGLVIEALKREGRFDNTLIIFLSDNGASNEVIQGKETRHGFFENGGTSPGIFPGGPDTYASYGPGWANASNTPYRRYKRWMHEGGISTPMIAHWPGVIAAGRVDWHVGHIIDLMPTFVELAGGNYPETFNNHNLTPLEGISLYPLFSGKKQEEHVALFWEHLGYRAARHGKWKIVSEGDEWQLYDLENDRTELANLADKFPERVVEMAGMWETWAMRANVKK